MSAHYDTYDYPSYWAKREYEHGAEIIALKSFLERIPKIKTILEIGAGYGRLTPAYIYRARKIILCDPSRKLLSIAKRKFTSSKVKFLTTTFENSQLKIKNKSVDLVIMVRVLHHIKDVQHTFEMIKTKLKRNGFIIFEFANKRHFKATISELLKGNLTFLFDIFPKDIRSRKSLRQKTLPFVNYHPDKIKEILTNVGFKVVEKRSVSNIRSAFLKRLLPKDVLLFLEKNIQRPFSYVNFGPSVFILAQRK